MTKRLNFYGIIFLLFSSIGILLSNDVSNTAPYQIDSFSIDKQSKFIASELRSNKMIQYSIVGGALGLGSYLAVRLLAPHNKTIHDIPVAPLGTFSIDDVKNLTAMASHYNTIQSKQKIGFIRTAFLVGKEMGMAVTQQLLVLTLFTGLNNSLGPLSKYIQYFDGLLTRTLEKIYHKGDLHWFIATHTHYKEMLEELQEQSKCLAEKRVAVLEGFPMRLVNTVTSDSATTTSGIDCGVHEKVIVDTWRAIIQDVERILGFIQYKKSMIDKKSGFFLQSSQEIIDSIMNKTNECTLQLHRDLQTEASALVAMSTFYSNFLEESLQRFIKFEPLIA